ncbi:alpha/beta fold hydrolase [Sedimentimonas flavescens]|uniref:alpha/beta fold hydrolase n=1 Tax=Sedimentimonas flavescens TaxID=2851012 RepID=UPI0021A38B11|nr:alpha/beta hydrolase [Sedimentimonas flavescens]MCT2539059.1 alpha/beta hydrolase [Sedimentimonas flavescens]
MEEAPFHAAISGGPEGGRALWLHTADERRIRLGLWPAAGEARGTVFIFPGRTEYIEKYGLAAAEFTARGYDVLAIDWRGQGLADRPLADQMMGHVERFAEYQIDLAAVLHAAEALNLPRPWLALGHSMGGTIALRALSRPHPFAAVTLSAPMLGIALNAPMRQIALPLARVLLDNPRARRYAPETSEVTYVLTDGFQNNFLTTDAMMWAKLIEQVAEVPALALGGPSLHWVAEALLECQALLKLPAPDLPCYCALGTDERVVDSTAIRQRLKDWPAARLEMFPGVQHEIMMDKPETGARFYASCLALFDAATGAA